MARKAVRTHEPIEVPVLLKVRFDGLVGVPQGDPEGSAQCYDPVVWPPRETAAP